MLSRWLWTVYSNLYTNFKTELFTLKEAEEILKMNKNRILVAFSKLHSNQALLIFKRNRPRVYRLLDPVNLIYLFSGKINLVKIKQERYLKLIYDVFRAIDEKFNLTSLAIYGSVARGTAKETSDVDILIISDDFKGSLASRIDELLNLDESIESELSWLRDKGIYTSLSFYPLKCTEAEKIPLIFLDLVEDAKIIYDKEGFLENILLSLKLKLKRLKAERIWLDKDKWIWDLKPDFKPMELIEI